MDAELFSLKNIGILWDATLQTLFMVSVSSFFAALFGIPLGVVLVVTQKGHILSSPRLNRVLGFLVNVGRAIPFLILMLFIIPLTRFLMGMYMGAPKVVIPPLVAAATPFVARMVESVLLEINKGVIEAAQSAGATPWQIIAKVLLPESLSGLITSMTIVVVNIIGYSTMSTVVGGKGLGQLAVAVGVNQYRFDVQTVIVVIFVIMVIGLQIFGDWLARRFSHR